MEAGNDRAESSETIGSTNERVAILHAKALLEDSAVTVGVSLEFHGYRDLILDNGVLERLASHDLLTIFHEDGSVLGGLD